MGEYLRERNKNEDGWETVTDIYALKHFTRKRKFMEAVDESEARNVCMNLNE